MDKCNTEISTHSKLITSSSSSSSFWFHLKLNSKNTVVLSCVCVCLCNVCMCYICDRREFNQNFQTIFGKFIIITWFIINGLITLITVANGWHAKCVICFEYLINSWMLSFNWCKHFSCISKTTKKNKFFFSFVICWSNSSMCVRLHSVIDT